MPWIPVGEVSIVYRGQPVTSDFAPTWAHTRTRMDVVAPSGDTLVTIEGDQGATLRWNGRGGVVGNAYRLEQYVMADAYGGNNGDDNGNNGGGGGALMVATVIGLWLLVRGR